MLAQNFQTPTALGISDGEFEALFKVLRMLERGEIQHMRGNIGDRPGGALEGENFTPHFFNMALVQLENDCGTAGCILGWARHVASDSRIFQERSPALDELFMMGPGFGGGFKGKFFSDILPSEAAIALRSYLTTGDPRWAEALAD